MKEKKPYEPQNFTDTDWQLITVALLRYQDKGRARELAHDVLNWRMRCAATSYQKGKNAGTAAAMNAYKQLEAQERQ